MRELYRGRATYELLQNADDVSAKRVAFVLTREGLGVLHDGDWFTAQNFESLALGWSDKDPNVCIGNKGLGFRSVLDITPAPQVFHADPQRYFGAKFSYALNNGHIQETLSRIPQIRNDIAKWGPITRTCPVMSIPGLIPKRSLTVAPAVILDRAARGEYGGEYSTLFWLPGVDPDVPKAVLDELRPQPLVAPASTDHLRRYVLEEVSSLILYLQHVSEVRLYEERTLIAWVAIPSHVRLDSGEFSIATTGPAGQATRTFFQVRKRIQVPPSIRADPETSSTLRTLSEAKIELSVEVVEGRPIANPNAVFHVYFPTLEPTGLGFAVHGDFYVKPDRTRLMPGAYNEWLFAEAAKLAAGQFLTDLIRATAQPRDVFEALRPVSSAAPVSAGARFVEHFQSALRDRPDPFVPTRDGPALPANVVMAPSVDVGEAWSHCVADEVANERRQLLDVAADTEFARGFLSLAGVQALASESLVDLVESAALRPRPPSWWFDCYRLLAGDAQVGRWNHQKFAGRALIPSSAGSVATVPDEGAATILILPPRGRLSLPEIPHSLAALLEFLDAEVAELLWSGDEETRSWVTSRFRLATFEVTDFLPRVLQTVASRLYEASALSTDELAAIWRFVHASLEAAPRDIHDEDVWQAVGRLPLPMVMAESGGTALSHDELVPAFLSYFPQDAAGGVALAGVEGMRRVASEFMALLRPDRAGGSTQEPERLSWRTLFERAGVSAGPKLLRYRRVVSEPPVPLSPQPPPLERGFTGLRHRDENRALVALVVTEGLWPSLVTGAQRCERHPDQVVIGEIAFVEGFGPCVSAALREFERGEPWVGRLRQLTDELPTALMENTQFVSVCQRCNSEGRRPGGTVMQLNKYSWVPSTRGPWSRNGAFLRLSSRRFIGLEASGVELGDLLLPYVVADSNDTYKRFVDLGVAPLEDSAASAPTLLRFLSMIGDALGEDAVAKQFVSARPRWRLIRGGIQEAYRALNRLSGYKAPPKLRLAIQTPEGARFRPAPWYFAEPGSVVERAFADQVGLLDADRVYAALFTGLGVSTLVAGQTVSEELLYSEEPAPADRLQEQITSGPSPHVLSVIVGRADESAHAALATRRLRERFAVRAVPALRLRLALADGRAKADVALGPYYMHRLVVEAEGGGREATYTLYVVGQARPDLFALDGDALGVALTPLFLDGLSDDLAPLIPRIMTKYQVTGGDTSAMEDFLLHTLGISREAQVSAAEIIGGDEPGRSATPLGPPPRLVSAQPVDEEVVDETHAIALQKLRETYELAQRKTAGDLAAREEPEEAKSTEAHSPPGRPTTRISPEQRARGLRGEEELLRRLQATEGWAGFRLIRDRRADGCGYDFLCSDALGDEAKLEVKTFVPDGRVFVSLRELHEALASRRSYYLVGVRDDGSAPTGWQTTIVHDPGNRLVGIGAFEVEALLAAPSAQLFGDAE